MISNKYLICKGLLNSASPLEKNFSENDWIFKPSLIMTHLV